MSLDLLIKVIWIWMEFKTIINFSAIVRFILICTLIVSIIFVVSNIFIILRNEGFEESCFYAWVFQLKLVSLFAF